MLMCFIWNKLLLHESIMWCKRNNIHIDKFSKFCRIYCIHEIHIINIKILRYILNIVKIKIKFALCVKDEGKVRPLKANYITYELH